jgi:hypothetical protein
MWSLAFRPRKGLSTTTIASLARRRAWDDDAYGPEPSPLVASCIRDSGMRRWKTYDGPSSFVEQSPDTHQDVGVQPRRGGGFDAFFRGRDGRSRRRRSRRPPTRPTVPPTGAMTTLRQRKLQRLSASRWTLPTSVEGRRRSFLPCRDEPTPMLSILVDDEPAARTVHRRGTRVRHPPDRCSGPTPCSRRTRMGQVIFACGVVPQASINSSASNNSSWRVR